MAAAEQAGSIETRTSWLVATAAVAILSVSFGAPIIVVVALLSIAADLGEARAVPALASSLAYLGAGAGGVPMGWLAGRYGMRRVAMAGGAMVCAGLVLASGGAAWQLLLGYGLLVGLLGNGALFPPLMAYVSLWFDRRRGAALALVSSGQYVAGALWPTLFERAVAAFGWQRTMLGFGLLAAAAVVPLAASRGALMLSLLLATAFVARQFWGWISDRIGGLNTLLAGSAAQTLGMAGFLLTQDEAGLFFVAAAYGLGFSGLVPAYVLTVRELFPAREAAWRVPVLLFLSLCGMAAGAWLAGFLFDRFGNYAVAWEAGIACNLANLAVLGVLALRQGRGPRRVPA